MQPFADASNDAASYTQTKSSALAASDGPPSDTPAASAPNASVALPQDARAGPASPKTRTTASGLERIVRERYHGQLPRRCRESMFPFGLNLEVARL
jgi:hypothetical protein